MAKRAIHACTAKRRFSDMAEALASAKPGLKAYLCPACGGFHLTSSGSATNGRLADAQEEKPSCFDVPVLLRATGGAKKRPEGVRKTVVAVCVTKPRPNGTIRIRIDKQEIETTEPVQPANLRHSLAPGTKVKVEVCLEKPVYARILGLK
jgi:hypothetical protein